MGRRLTVWRALVASLDCQPIKVLFTDTFKVGSLVATNMQASTTTEHTCDTCGGTEFTVSIYRSATLGSALMIFCASPTCEKIYPDMIQTAVGDNLS